MPRYLTRVNIETSFFSDRRNQKLQSVLFSFEGIGKFDAARYLATGIMADLWRLSQAEKAAEATREQIDDWLFEGATDLLLDAGFISESNAAFYIKGNSEQLEGINAWLDQKAVAGKRSAERRAEKRTENHDASQKMVNDRSTVVQRSFNGRSTVVQRSFNESQRSSTNGQRNPTQYQDQLQDQLQDQKEERRVASAVCAEPKQPPRPRQKSKDSFAQECGNEVTQVWEAFANSLEEGFNTRPPRNAKTNTQAKQLIAAVGFENAMKLAEYYPKRRKAYYVSRGFPFGLLLTDYNALLMEISGGQKLTQSTVRAIENKEIAENSCKTMDIGVELLSMDREQFEAYLRSHPELTIPEDTPLLGGSNEDDTTNF